MDFEEYVASHGQDLLRLAFVLTSDCYRAEDLTQSALTEAYTRWRKISATQNPHAYVRKMLVNRNIDWHRRRSSSEQPSSPDWINRSLIRTSESDHFTAYADRDRLRTMVAELSPRARTAVVLRYYCDLDDDAIAKVMDIRANSVRALTSRALESLRRLSTEKELL